MPNRVGRLSRNMSAVPPAHQHAILSVAEIGEGHRKPDPDACQRGCKRDRGDIRNHPVAILVRAFALALESGQVGCQIAGWPGRRRSGVRPRTEFEDAVFAVIHEKRFQISTSILVRRTNVSPKKKVFL